MQLSGFHSGTSVAMVRFSLNAMLFCIVPSRTPFNCVGCGLCANECPGKKGEKALKMVDVNSQLYLEPFLSLTNGLEGLAPQ